MLVTLRHLLVLVAGFVVAVCAGPLAADRLALNRAWVVPVVLSMLLVEVPLLWPVFAALRLRPLILPKCPGCGERHGNYSIPRDAWPNPVIVCHQCGSPLQLLLTGGAPVGGRLASAHPRFPRFLGSWVYRQAGQ